ncbi:MAG: PaaI family thioesterase [Rikenellaceae bacterium]
MKFEEIYKHDIFANEAGVVLQSVSDTEAVMTLKVERRHLNGGNFAHGGAIYLLCDIAMAALANHRQPISVSIQTDIKFISVAVEGDLLTATAEEIIGRKTLYYSRVSVRNQEGKLIATAEGMLHTKPNAVVGR